MSARWSKARTAAFAFAVAGMLAVAVFAPPGLHGQETAEWYREQADEAILAERYDRAVEILQQAQREHGDIPEFFMRLGDLYYGEELYGLALAEYEKAEMRDPTSYQVLEAAAFTLGLLNREEESAEYWSDLVDLYPDRIEPRQNLGWLLFKLHRLEEGLSFLRSSWEQFGPDADLAMTLGTINAELYRFSEAHEWYTRSIELARSNESESFVAVAFYNLSLIQKLFHRYEDALESTEHSISMLPRPTGYLARGELFELRLDFTAAHADYLRAYETDDDTPLARMNLALLYRRFGRLEEALAFAESVFEESDRSWLYYYGTDVDRHRMELHDLLGEIHTGLAEAARMRVTGGLWGRLERSWDVARHRVLGWYHRSRFRAYAGRVAAKVIDGGNLIDGNWYLYRANEAHPRVALTYLERARRLETMVIPESDPSYESERNALLHRTDDLLLLAAGLDSVWQRQLLEETLVGALVAGRRLDARRIAAVRRLYELNPGALRQHGIRLPVRLVVEGAAIAAEERRVRRMVARGGFEPLSDDRGLSAPELRVQVRAGAIAARLVLPSGPVTAEAPRDDPSARALAAAINEVAQSIFVVR